VSEALSNFNCMYVAYICMYPISYRFEVIVDYCLVDFLFVIIELCSLRMTAEALRAKID